MGRKRIACESRIAFDEGRLYACVLNKMTQRKAPYL